MIDRAANHWRSIRSGLKSDRPMDVGKAITKAFLTLVVALALLPQFTSDGGWQLRGWAFAVSPPNEIGDTFAGIAGVLAFLWIIVTVWLQSQELAAQRAELKATRAELKLAREAQEQQVAVMKEQAEVFRDEQRQRDEIRAKKLLDERLFFLAHVFAEKSGIIGWEVEVEFTGIFGGKKRTPEIQEHVLCLFEFSHHDIEPAESFKFMRVAAKKTENGLRQVNEMIGGELYRAQVIWFQKRRPKENVEDLLFELSKVTSLAERLSEADRQYLENTGVYAISEALKELMHLPVWEDGPQPVKEATQ